MITEQTRKIEFRGEEFDQFHGSPFDRGSADSWYGRAQAPHWYPEGTYKGTRVEAQDMTLAELRAYYAGYEYNELSGGKKQY
jgi:hypothetical protein